MSFTIKYSKLFSVQVLHAYDLDRGARAFESLLEKDRQDILSTYDAQQVLRVRPTSDTAKELQNRGLLFRQDASGFFVGARTDNNSSTPTIPMNSPFVLTFVLFPATPYLINQSSLRLGALPTTPPEVKTHLDPKPAAVYLFSNLSDNAKKEINYLSKPVPAEDSSIAYQAGDLRVDDEANPSTLHQAIRYTGPGIDATDWQEVVLAPAFTPPLTDYAPGDAVIHNNQLFVAKTDPPEASPPNEDHWEEVPLTHQYVTHRDQIEVVPSLFSIDLTQENTTAATLKLSDPIDPAKVIFEETQNSNRTLSSFSADLRDVPTGLFEVELSDLDGNQITEGIPQQIYHNTQLYRSGAFGIISIYHTPDDSLGAYKLQDVVTGSLLQPAYTIRFLNRSTFWRYIVNPAQPIDTSNLNNNLQEENPVNGKQRIRTKTVRPLTRSVQELRLETNEATEKLLPNPDVRLVRVDKGDKQVYSEIHI